MTPPVANETTISETQRHRPTDSLRNPAALHGELRCYAAPNAPLDWRSSREGDRLGERLRRDPGSESGQMNRCDALLRSGSLGDFGCRRKPGPKQISTSACSRSAKVRIEHDSSRLGSC